jgi:LemA protein
VAEHYPDLKANATFRQLMTELVDTEDRIAAARRFYNGNVRALNTRVEGFPSGLVARKFGVRKAAYFEVDDVVVSGAVSVDFASLVSLDEPVRIQGD